jgi:Amt family ammonium transporter
VRGLIVGEWAQLVAQAIDSVVVVAWSLGTSLLMFWVIQKTIGLRAPREDELTGLDLPEHGLEAYPEGRKIVLGRVA